MGYELDIKENESLLMAAITGDYRAISGLGQCPDADFMKSKGATLIGFGFNGSMMPLKRLDLFFCQHLLR